MNLEFEKFGGSITECSSNLSESGIFVKSQDPKPIGTVLSFEFKLKDDSPPVHGLGEVAWVRNEDRGPDKPKGMGIRFQEMDERSRELVRTAVAGYLSEPGVPFETHPPAPNSPSESPPGPDESPPLEQEFGSLFSSSEDRSRALSEMGILVDEERSLTDVEMAASHKYAPKPIRRWVRPVKRLVLGALVILGLAVVWNLFPAQVQGIWKFISGANRPHPTESISYEENFTAKAPKAPAEANPPAPSAP